jgi:hypothetical protein
MTIELALTEFKKYKVEFETFLQSDLSESDTRSKIIDIIFLNILGWNETNITREPYVKKIGYYDYVFSTGIFHFVVEAKRNFLDFKIPKKKKTKISLLYTDKTNKEVIDQIRSYVTSKNLSFGIITNGKQFIVSSFVSFNGIPWEDNECIVFNGLEDIEQRFIEFYELLSREYVLKFGRIKILSDQTFSKKIVNNPILPRKNDKLVRNDLSSRLIPLINALFTKLDWTNELYGEDVLAECFVFNDDLHKHYSEMSVLFEDSPPKFDERISKVKNTKSTQDIIRDNLVQAKSILPDPIILIGGKGAGKTTFINYFFKINLEEKIKKIIPEIYIDFIGFTLQQIKDTKSVYQKIIDAIYETHPELKLTNYDILKRIYKKEINRNIEEGLWSIYKNNAEKLEDKINSFLEEKINNPETHLKAISEYLINPSHKRLCIIFDNVDQLDFEEAQREAFLLAESMYKNLKCLIIISLREGYFYKWRALPPFDAFQSNVFHITAPSYREVLKKRLTYVVDNFKYNSLEGDIQNKHFEISNTALKNLFKSIYKTLFIKENSEILQFLEQTSFPNIRLGLDKFNGFLISGHTKVEEYMASDTFNIPIWEFIKSVALESNYYYNYKTSKIHNLFYPSNSNNSHFTKIRILKYLYNQAQNNAFNEYFIPVEAIKNLFVQAGYTRDIIIEEIELLINYNLISCENFNSDTENKTSNIELFQVKITQGGIYYINNLINTFVYIDIILEDTLIFDENFYDEILCNFSPPDASGKKLIHKRLKTVKVFIEYLKKQEFNEHQNSYTDNLDKVFEWNITEYILDSNLNNDIQRLEKQLSPYNFGSRKVTP